MPPMGTNESKTKKQTKGGNSKSIRSSLLYASRPATTNKKNESSKTSNINSKKDINANDISNGSSTMKSDQKYVPKSATTNANTSNSSSSIMKSSTMYVPPSDTTNTKTEANESGNTTWSPWMDGLVRSRDETKDLSFVDNIINRVLCGPEKMRRRLPVFQEIYYDESPITE